jgi:hypothetical protein
VYSADVVVFVVSRLEQQVALTPLHLHPQLTFVREIRAARLSHLNNTEQAVNNGLYKDEHSLFQSTSGGMYSTNQRKGQLNVMTAE